MSSRLQPSKSDPALVAQSLLFLMFFFYFHASIFKTLFLIYLPPVHSTPPSKTKRCHPYSLKVVTNKKIEKTSVHKARRKWGPLWTVGSYVKWYGHCQMNCEIPGGKKSKYCMIQKSLFGRTSQKNWKQRHRRDVCTLMFIHIIGIVVNKQNGKANQVSINRWTDKQTVV